MISNGDSIERIDGKNYIPAIILERIMEDRDRCIRRIELATETKRKLMQAKTLEESEAICIPDEFKLFGEFDKCVMDSYVSGFTLATDEGSPRCHYGSMGAIASIVTPELYRGEIRDYGLTSGLSSLGRSIRFNGMNQSLESKLLSFFIEQVRKVIFMGFLTCFRQFHEFPFGEPLDGLIAQHYGLKTQFIDLTDDIKVALFFACCRHEGNNLYRPINEGDISEIGKEGIIYRGYSDRARIIGFQPFCRCHRQRGYYIDTAVAEPCWEFILSKDTGFEKYYFDRTVELSERLYEEFDGGKTLFPDDGLEPFAEVIAQMQIEKAFPSEAFDIAYKVFCLYLETYRANRTISNEIISIMRNKDYLISKLQSGGFVLCSQLKLKASQRVIGEMNIDWDPVEFAQKEGFFYSPFIISDK